VRIAVARFSPDRSQRRCLARNAGIEARVLPARRTPEHFALYQRYLGARHPRGGMDGHGTAEFDQFLIGEWSDSRFLELRDATSQQLLAVAVTDLADNALSAVYTFYDPAHAGLSLGTLAILHQIEWARRDHRDHVYLGYWIAGHRKMDYKRRFSGLEGFNGSDWRPLQFDAEGGLIASAERFSQPALRLRRLAKRPV
jgi:arginine-tRNA-protein transferase